MTVLVGDGAGVSQTRWPLLRAFGAALLLEAAILAGSVVWLAQRHVPPAAEKPAMQISLVTLPPPPQPVAPPASAPPPPAVQPAPKPQPQPKPLAKPRSKPERKLPPQPPKIVELAPQPRANTVDYPTPPARPIAQLAVPSADALAAFEGRVRQAVQAAMVYPPAARMMRQQGRARVAFDYRDGKASEIRLVQSSGFDLLDNAALAAVRSGAYPPPPSQLQLRTMDFVVWVRFRFAAEE